MNYQSKLNPVFDKSAIEAEKSRVMTSVESYIHSGSNLTPSKWVHTKRRSWTGVQKASFIHFAKNHPEYINPHLKNIHSTYYDTHRNN